MWYNIGMKVFAISDLHLSNATNKPMDVFGAHWSGHFDKIKAYFYDNVTDEDVVLIAGDTSWGMTIAEATPDLLAVDALPGKKFIIRGNHDYWWSGYSKIKAIGLKTVTFIQNNAFRVGSYVICGTRGWTIPDETTTVEDKKIFDRELIRLKLTLDDAQKLLQEGDKLYLMTHYPPFDARFSDSAFTETIARYPVDTVVYGHLHGNVSRSSEVVYKNNVRYLLTSCDFLSFTPIRID